MNKEEHEKEQKELVKALDIPKQDIVLKRGDLIFTVDVQYKGEWGYTAVDVQEWDREPIGVFVKRAKVSEKYQAGYFAFREGPLILKAIEQLKEQRDLFPSLIIVDGHGTAHPRQMGLACWVGIKTGIPTIGLAKAPLIEHGTKVDKMKGSRSLVIKDNKVLGYVLRTKQGVKPVYVSSGNLISQKQAVNIIYELRGEHRIIEPMRRADKAARECAKEANESEE